jgi:hypothetical protein
VAKTLSYMIVVVCQIVSCGMCGTCDKTILISVDFACCSRFTGFLRGAVSYVDCWRGRDAGREAVSRGVDVRRSSGRRIALDWGKLAHIISIRVMYPACVIVFAKIFCGRWEPLTESLI